ncbi:MAG: hypothetical protein HYS05_21695 [Acidobacteria bacterium]|nr:hypothetical protein [Acidobacteriota bacterium]
MKRETLEVECWFLIPLVRDSDRRLHQPVLWRLREEALSDAWGGWTGPETMRWGRKYGTVHGGWKPEGSTDPVTDESRKYTVFVPPASLDALRSLLKKAAKFVRSTGGSLERSWTT